MKKLLAFIIVLFIANSIFAQLSVGPRLGVNISSQTFISDDKDIQKSINDSTSSLAGVSFGGILNIKRGDVKEFQLELLYLQKGYQNKYEFGGSTMTTKNRLNYFNAKTLWNFGGGNKRKWMAYGQIGPYIGFWLSGKTTFEDLEVDYEFEDIDNEQQELRNIRFDFGISIGGGFKYKVGPGWVEFNPRFSHGFAPQIIDDQKSYWTANLNRNFSLNFGYLYVL